MADSYHANNSNKVSAIDSSLKLLKGVCRKAAHVLGLLVIDRAMRQIVAMYDKRGHKSKAYKTQGGEEEIGRLYSRITMLNDSIAALKNTVSVLQADKDELKLQNDALKSELNRLIDINSDLNQKSGELQHRVGDLQSENSQLLRRCMPSSEIPSMVYYVQGDVSGVNFRKISTVKTPQHIYRISTIPGDATSALFEPIVESGIEEVIRNRSITLVACEIMSIAPNASSIVVREKGKAIYKNNKWTVTSKAKIELA